MIRVAVRVQPGASRDEVTSFEEETLRVRLRARAVEGKANASLLAFLADALRLRPYQLTILRGEQSREKLLQIELDSHKELLARLRLP